jgi:hypothetical protein
MRWLPAVTAGGLALSCALFGGCGKVEPKVLADFPAREAPNYQGLVSVTWVKGLLDYQQSGFQTPRPPTYRNQRFVILDGQLGHAGEGEGLPERPPAGSDPFQHR